MYHQTNTINRALLIFKRLFLCFLVATLLISNGVNALKAEDEDDFVITEENAERKNSLGKKGPNKDELPMIPVYRITDSNVKGEAYKIARELRYIQGISRFDTVVIATEADFADALSGSYLAAMKRAPILYIDKSSNQDVLDFLRINLYAGGTVYLLGDANAIPESFEEQLDAYEVKRLAGSSRYMTNLEILKEVGMTESGDIVVVTGSGYADSLSAGALGLPIMMVNNGDTKLKNSQKNFLKYNVKGKVYILGDTNAVNASLEKQLKAYGPITRIGGSSRWETTKLIAQKFFSDPGLIVLATGEDFREGLIASPLAYMTGAPLILVTSNKTYQAKLYATAHEMYYGYVVGSASQISDEAVAKIFGNNEVFIEELDYHDTYIYIGFNDNSTIMIDVEDASQKICFSYESGQITIYDDFADNCVGTFITKEEADQVIDYVHNHIEDYYIMTDEEIDAVNSDGTMLVAEALTNDDYFDQFTNFAVVSFEAIGYAVILYGTDAVDPELMDNIVNRIHFVAAAE